MIVPANPPSAANGASFERELEVAIKITREAGKIVETFYQVPLTVKWKEELEPVTEADRAANAFIIKQLAAAFPDDGILAEESQDDLSRLDKRRVWLVDPLDGTMEFIERNGQFCLMIGLIVDGTPVVGVVYQPVEDLLFAAAQGQGAFMVQEGDRTPLHISRTSDIKKMRPVVSRSHRPALLTGLLKALGVQRERNIGSVGLKVGLIARGKADLYLHPSAGAKEWDTCAPEVIMREAGGMMTDCWNRPLLYNGRDVRRQYGVLASNGLCHAQISATVAALLDEAGVDPEFGF